LLLHLPILLESRESLFIGGGQVWLPSWLFSVFVYKIAICTAAKIIITSKLLVFNNCFFIQCNVSVTRPTPAGVRKLPKGLPYKVMLHFFVGAIRQYLFV
jgi:hypothetical protein